MGATGSSVSHEAPEQTSEHHRIFRAPVVFGCETNALVIELGFTEREVPAADQQLYQIMKQYLDQVLSEMPRKTAFSARFERRSQNRCAMGIELAQVAKKMAMGPRTLQRRLKEYGFDFKKLVEDTRQRFAVSYLKDRKTLLPRSLSCWATRSLGPSTERLNVGPALRLWTTNARC